MGSHEGFAVIEQSVDIPKQIEASTAPVIQISFPLGGVNTPKALPEAIIEAEKVEIDE